MSSKFKSDIYTTTRHIKLTLGAVPALTLQLTFQQVPAAPQATLKIQPSEQGAPGALKIKAPQPTSKYNPSPYGLAGFATTTLVASMYTIHAKDIHIANVLVGMAVFFGGGGQFLVGMFECIAGNTFGMVTFTSYGAYWIGYGCMYIPAFGIKDAYEPEEWDNALGLYFSAWALMTFMFTMFTFQLVPLCLQFVFLGLNYLVLGAGLLVRNDNVLVGGGAMGIVAAAFGFWNSYFGIANPFNSYFWVERNTGYDKTN